MSVIYFSMITGNFFLPNAISSKNKVLNTMTNHFENEIWPNNKIYGEGGKMSEVGKMSVIYFSMITGNFLSYHCACAIFLISMHFKFTFTVTLVQNACLVQNAGLQNRLWNVVEKSKIDIFTYKFAPKFIEVYLTLLNLSFTFLTSQFKMAAIFLLKIVFFYLVVWHHPLLRNVRSCNGILFDID